jgi:hypothetical protein
MAKRTTVTAAEIHKDVLIKTREQFNNELDKRLDLGSELIKRPITNQADLAKSHDDFQSWDDYNTELLKQSFDRPNNDYHREYTYSGYFFGTMGGSRPSFPELIQDHKSEIEKQFGRLKKIRDKVDLIDTRVVAQGPPPSKTKDETQIAFEILSNLFSKFHRIAQTLRNRHDNRPTLLIKDEYDVQDLLRAILKEHFDDVRDEDYVSSYAGSNSRVDFVLKNEKVVIEVKMTNDKLKDKEVGSQLLIDIGRYKNHPDCKLLVLFIYDKGDLIVNKPGLIRDLNNMSAAGLPIKTFINPE